MKKIAFFTKHFSERGTDTAIYDYAYYNQTILNNKSMIIGFKDCIEKNPDVYEKYIEHFDVKEIEKFNDIHKLLIDEKCDILYILKAGEIDEEVTDVCKCVIHCVYGSMTPHGDVYLPVGPFGVKINDNRGGSYGVPHIVSLPDVDGDMREELNIPKNSLVFGGYGGMDSFNIDFAREGVYEIAKENKDIYFLFANFEKFCEDLPNIIHLPRIINLKNKVKFINTCDAMIHAQSLGETFGLAIAEFSSKNKPIIATKMAKDDGGLMHVYMLGNKAFWYRNKQELKNIILSFDKELNSYRDWNAYREYNPENVMRYFDKVFIQ